MMGTIVPLAVFVLVFTGIFVAYAIGRRDASAPTQPRATHAVTSADIVIEYRAEGRASPYLQRIRVVEWMQSRHGRLYLYGLRNDGKQRMFRVDRIVSIAIPDGEVLDMQRYLVERLAVPAELCAAQIRAR